MNKIDDMLLVLIAIKHKVNYSEFLIKYFDFDELGSLCIKAIEKGLIVEIRDEFVITSMGLEYINQMNKDLKRKRIEKELPLLQKYVKEKLPIESIYLPLKY